MCTIFLSMFISFLCMFRGGYVPIIRRNNCIYATLGICYSAWMTVWYAGWIEIHSFHSNLHTRQSSTQNNKYQVSHKHSYLSWWWAHNRPKHVEKRNKHNKENCATSWFYLQNCVTVEWLYRGADKSLARPGRKQAIATEDFEFHISYL